MKKVIISILVAMMAIVNAAADEGMWMLPLLQKLNENAMKQLGCKLSADDIYSINHSSIKDAIVMFGGGCTGELISDKGLLVTNHHCGYSSIQKLSSDEHNYLENGFWAMSQKEKSRLRASP
jgi:Peptidase S46.